jgi:regulator of RNase E activity RraA
VLAATLASLKANTRFAGWAACVSGVPIITAPNISRPLPADVLEQAAGVDTVLVIGTGGFGAVSVMGGFVAYSLQRGGCRGLLTDGAIRDADEIAASIFPSCPPGSRPSTAPAAGG